MPIFATRLGFELILGQTLVYRDWLCHDVDRTSLRDIDNRYPSLRARRLSWWVVSHQDVICSR